MRGVLALDSEPEASVAMRMLCGGLLLKLNHLQKLVSFAVFCGIVRDFVQVWDGPRGVHAKSVEHVSTASFLG